MGDGKALIKAAEIVDNDAFKIGQAYRKARRAMVDSVKHFRECGLMLIDKKKSLAHGEWLPWLEANAEVLGFDSKHTAARLIKLAVKSSVDATFDEDEAIQISREIWGNKGDSELVQQSLSNEHYTPKEYITAARKVLGTIDLDPASCKEANAAVRAKRFFTEKDDGLVQDWYGRVWLNPPYGNLAADFVVKLANEYKAKKIKAAIVLVNAHCTDTKWFQYLWDGMLCFTDHRINFYGDDERSGSTHGSVFVYFGSSKLKFTKNFRQFGRIVKAVA